MDEYSNVFVEVVIMLVIALILLQTAMIFSLV